MAIRDKRGRGGGGYAAILRKKKLQGGPATRTIARLAGGPSLAKIRREEKKEKPMRRENGSGFLSGFNHPGQGIPMATSGGNGRGGKGMG